MPTFALKADLKLIEANTQYAVQTSMPDNAQTLKRPIILAIFLNQ